MPPSPLVLVGFMGCGKSTVGRLLARTLGWHFHDLDERIEAAVGLPIATIFSKQGEAAFRSIERHQLDLLLQEARVRRSVIALGGGTFAQPANAQLLLQSPGLILFLDVPVEELLLRLAQVTNRPLFRDEHSFRALYERRLPFYRQAHVTVPGSGTPEEVVERIVRQLPEGAVAGSATPLAGLGFPNREGEA